jgi:hypothetical protein
VVVSGTGSVAGTSVVTGVSGSAKHTEVIAMTAAKNPTVTFLKSIIYSPDIVFAVNKGCRHKDRSP